MLFYVEPTDSEIGGDYSENSAIASNPTGDKTIGVDKIGDENFIVQQQQQNQTSEFFLS